MSATAKPPWTGKRVWIVGASSGIGAALARELARRGATLILSARSADPLQKLVDDLGGGIHRAIAFDVTDERAIKGAADQAQSDGPVDLLVQAAGAYKPMRAFAIDLPAAKAMIDTNLKGTLGCVAAIVPAMLARGQGHIAIVASVAGYSGLPNALAYGATKAALINMAETMHLDLGPRGIKVQVINPGFVATPLTASNEFKMPALITPEQAATAIANGLERHGFEIHFPKRFSMVLKFLRLLPYAIYFRLIRRATGL